MTVSDYITARRATPDMAARWAEIDRFLAILGANFGIRQYNPTGGDHVLRLK